MNDELKGLLKKSSLTELLSIYEDICNTKKAVIGNKVVVTEKDLKPKRKKRGSKN